MIERKYDNIIQQHYKKVAKEEGLSATSTMADGITRELETDAIIQFVSEFLRLRQAEYASRRVIIMDVGCGNGHTLGVLSKKYPDQYFVGIEKSDELARLALARFNSHSNIKILKGDIRNSKFAASDSVDILICQRVLINILDHQDQKLALNNIIDVVTSPDKDKRQSGGVLLFIESFLDPMARLNGARFEFDLPPISPAHHNLYLDDNFFDSSKLKPLESDGHIPPSNFLSTHYFVTRVLHPILTQNRPFKRDSEFVHFFSEALKKNVGNYSPLKLYVFEKAGKD